MELLEIISAKYNGDYCIVVTFNNGECREMDFSDIVNRYPVFRPLKDKSLFSKFIVTDTLEWIDGTIDIAPEYVYEHGKVVYVCPDDPPGMVAEDIEKN